VGENLSEEYDLKRSEKIGQLYPVLIDSAGNVIDGLHRLEVDPDWRKEKLTQINTEEKFLIARCVANWNRRQITRQEKEEWINGLARIYQKQGLKVRGGDPPHPNEVVSRIIEVTGLSSWAVKQNLSDDFKQIEFTRKFPQEPRVPASQRIETQLGAKVVAKHEVEVAKKLFTEPQFFRKTMAQVEIPKREPTFVPPAKVEQMQRQAKAITNMMEEKGEDPLVQKRRELFKNWNNLRWLLDAAQQSICPICGGDYTNLLWRCHGLSIQEATKIARENLEALNEKNKI